MMNSDVRGAIQSAMREVFPAVERRMADFYAMQEYQLGWRDTDLRPANFDPGKLLRPQLTLLASQAAGGDIARALPLAAGIQLFHDFTLIHDDIEDASETRRGRVTVWKQWGLAHGINAGDSMFTLAHLALHRLADVGVSAPVLVEVLRRFDQTILMICEGQYLDLSFEGNLKITEDDYIAMINGKTAVLVGAATSLGGLVGGANTTAVQALWDFGRNVGLAFQIQDDVLGIWAGAEVTGKIAAADLYRRKVSLPIIHALAHDHSGELAAIYRQTEVTANDIPRALAVLDRTGSRTYAEDMAFHYYSAAIRALSRFPGVDRPASTEARARLRAIADQALPTLQIAAKRQPAEVA